MNIKVSVQGCIMEARRAVRRSVLAVSLASALSILASCAATPPAPPVPPWYLAPPLHDGAKLYGAGEGATADAAAKEALNQVASRLSVTVSSRFEKRETQSQARGATVFDREIRNDLQSRVSEMKFNNYEIVRNEVSGHRHYVLVAVDKEVLLAEKRNDLAAADATIESMYRAAQQKGIVDEIRGLDAVAARVAQAVALVNLIASLDPSFGTDRYLSRYNGYLAEGRDARARLRVYLAHEREADDVAPVVKEFLNSAGIPVAAASSGDRDLVVLALKTKRKELEVYGSKSVKLSTLFEVKDASDRLVYSCTIESSGHSMISFSEAAKAAALDLEGKMKKRGVSVLGIDRSAD